MHATQDTQRIDDLALTIAVGQMFRTMRQRLAQQQFIYRETTVRAQYRALFDAAGQVPGTEMLVTFIKNDWTVRTMRCKSIGPDSDGTRRYVTVYDLEKEGYRRIALDAIVRLSVTVGV
jgi:hypothetical protein